jgi:hypothetical protein
VLHNGKGIQWEHLLSQYGSLEDVAMVDSSTASSMASRPEKKVDGHQNLEGSDHVEEMKGAYEYSA